MTKPDSPLPGPFAKVVADDLIGRLQLAPHTTSAGEPLAAEFARAEPGPLRRDVEGLRELLAARQELDLAQARRIEELERELGETHAKLRAEQRERERVENLLRGYSRPEHFARNTATVNPA